MNNNNENNNIERNELSQRIKEKQRYYEKIYSFLMDLCNANEEERANAKMKNGMTYQSAIRRLNSSYKRGILLLSPDQIADLMKYNFLSFTQHDKEAIAKSCELPVNDAVDIIKAYHSHNAFTDSYKTFQLDYDFSKKQFIGKRSIVLSENDFTEEQKLHYIRLIEDIFEKGIANYNTGAYLDIDELNEQLSTILSSKEQRIIELSYGLSTKKQSFKQIAKEFNSNDHSILSQKTNILKKLRNTCDFSLFLHNISADIAELQEYEKLQPLIEHLLDSRVPITDDISSSIIKSFQSFHNSKDTLQERISRYNMAEEYYLNKENLFDPNATIPSVPRMERQLPLSEYENAKLYIKALSILKLFISNEDGEPFDRNEIENVQLKNICTDNIIQDLTGKQASAKNVKTSVKTLDDILHYFDEAQVKVYYQHVPIEKLNFSANLSGFFKHTNIDTVFALMQHSENDLFEMGCVNRIYLSAIKRELAKLGLQLKGENQHLNPITIPPEIQTKVRQNSVSILLNRCDLFIQKYSQTLEMLKLRKALFTTFATEVDTSQQNTEQSSTPEQEEDRQRKLFESLKISQQKIAQLEQELQQLEKNQDDDSSR